eukprot:283245-Pleurochrysis_carterae.AAC.1
MACFRVRGSAVMAEVAKAQPVSLPHFGLLSRARRARSAAPRERSGRRRGVRRRCGGRRWRWCGRRCLGLTRFDRCVSGLRYVAFESQMRGDDTSEQEI